MASACFCTTGSALVRALRLKTDSTPVTAMPTTTMNTSSSIRLRPRSSVDIAGFLFDEHMMRPTAVDLDVEPGSEVHGAPAGIEVERCRRRDCHAAWRAASEARMPATTITRISSTMVKPPQMRRFLVAFNALMHRFSSPLCCQWHWQKRGNLPEARHWQPLRYSGRNRWQD